MATPTHITDGTGSSRRACVDEDNRLCVEAKIAQGQAVSIVPLSAGNISSLFREFLADSGGLNNMVINGASTPTDFTLEADSLKDIVLTEIRYTMTTLSFNWGGTHFGKGGGVLANGILIDIFIDGVTTEIGTIMINEDLLMLPARNDVLLGQSGNKDVLAMSVDLGGLVVLAKGTSDRVRVRIQDDLTSGARDINYLRFAGFGSKQ